MNSQVLEATGGMEEKAVVKCQMSLKRSNVRTGENRLDLELTHRNLSGQSIGVVR